MVGPEEGKLSEALKRWAPARFGLLQPERDFALSFQSRSLQLTESTGAHSVNPQLIEIQSLVQPPPSSRQTLLDNNTLRRRDCLPSPRPLLVNIHRSTRLERTPFTKG